MKRKLIYFSSMPLLAVTVQKYYMKELAEAGFEIEYLNLGPLLPHYIPSSEPILYPAIERMIFSLKELSQYIRQQDIDKAIFISHITYYPAARKIFRLLHKMHCRTCCMAIGMLPVVSSFAMGRKKFLFRLKRLTLRRLYHYFQFRLTPFLIKTGYLSNYDIIFFAGNILWKRNSALWLQNPERAKALVAINTIDYDLALSVRDKKPMVKGEYILFLDEYLPLHPDFALLGWNIHMDVAKYYRELNDFFDRMEQYYQMPVVIAAHPKAERYRNENFFEGRTVVFGSTALLARDARLVVTHHSTAVGFAVIFQKPLVLASSQDIRSSLGAAQGDILSLAWELSVQVVDYDDVNLDFATISMEIPQDKYDAYKYAYLTNPESENQNTLDILLKHLPSI